MSISQELVDKILDDVEIADHIGQYVPLKSHGKNELFACCPFHNEHTPSFTVTPNKRLFYCFGCKASGNVIQFEQQMFGLTFEQAANKLANQYGIDREVRPTSESILLMRKYNRCKKKFDEVSSHAILPSDYMNRFVDSPAVEWISEGITAEKQQEFGVRLDFSSNRIVYPVYDVCGNLINVKGRTRYEDYKALGIPKYINYHKVGDLDYFQGLNKTKEAIAERREMIIFESIKSVMKAELFGTPNVVSAETSTLNMFQIKLALSMHCDVVIAFDNDVSRAESAKFLSTLRKYTNVYWIDDKERLLGTYKDKMSPVDKGKEIWDYLYKRKVRV